MIVEIYTGLYQPGSYDLDDEAIASPMLEYIPRIGEHVALYLEYKKGYRHFLVNHVEHMIDCVNKHDHHQVSIWVTEIAK